MQSTAENYINNTKADSFDSHDGYNNLGEDVINNNFTDKIDAYKREDFDLKTNTTHFGFSQVDIKEKEKLVGKVFNSVADKYDIMNDVMSFGVHRFWKYYTLMCANVRTNMHILDLASGTCDLAIIMAKQLAGTGRLVASDINASMLTVGENRMHDAGIIDAEFVVANAEKLPFADNSFDLVTMAFGLRNVTNKDKALTDIYRVLKPGGKLLVLEFSKPTIALVDKVYDLYSFHLLPRIGKTIANDADSYRYLAESIRMHPDQQTLKQMFVNSGFCCTKYQNLSAGIVAIHQGIKL